MHELLKRGPFLGAEINTILLLRHRGSHSGVVLAPDSIPGCSTPQNHPDGVLAELMAKLAEAKINVTACDAVAAGAGQYGAILWVKPGDVQKAARVLGAAK